jgi:hypothetical protein
MSPPSAQSQPRSPSRHGLSPHLPHTHPPPPSAPSPLPLPRRRRRLPALAHPPTRLSKLVCCGCRARFLFFGLARTGAPAARQGNSAVQAEPEGSGPRMCCFVRLCILFLRGHSTLAQVCRPRPPLPRCALPSPAPPRSLLFSALLTLWSPLSGCWAGFCPVSLCISHLHRPRRLALSRLPSPSRPHPHLNHTSLQPPWCASTSSMTP